MPTVSVIIPTYNRSSIVRQAIESILMQSRADFEIIIVDDGSTDDTRSIVESFGDGRIKYVYQTNSGASIARNAGMAKASGQYIAFLDSDDTWPKNFLAVMLEALSNNPDYGLAYCLTSVKNPDGSINDHDSPERCFSGNITDRLFINSVIWPSATIFKKDISADILFDAQLKNSEDSDFLLRLSTKAKCLFVDGIRAVRAASPDSLSHAAGINCARILSLERFYFNLGGDKLISRRTAFNKLSKAYRRIAERHRKKNNKKAALYLYKKAVRYRVTDFRLYWGLFMSCLIKKDKSPDWQMPKPLGLPVKDPNISVGV